jgi:MarR family transcriptional regulator, organic hydroperoxide resistance regulator
MLERRNQIEGILQSFYAIKNKIKTDNCIILAKHQVTGSQLMVMRTVYKNDGIGIKELSHMLGISSSAVTQLVDGLVKSGYLTREGSLEDRRALKLRLSEKTKNILDSSKTQSLGKVYTLFDVLSDEELQIYHDLSKKVAGKILEK